MPMPAATPAWTGPWRSSSSQDVDLAIATLPEGLDPCDLLVQQGPEPFRQALAGAVDALDFKLSQVLNGGAGTRRGSPQGGGRRAGSALPWRRRCRAEAGRVKTATDGQSHRPAAGPAGRTVWARLKELRGEQGATARNAARAGEAGAGAERQAPAAPARGTTAGGAAGASRRWCRWRRPRCRAERSQHPGLRRCSKGCTPCRPQGQLPGPRRAVALRSTIRGWRTTPWRCRTWPGESRTRRPGCSGCLAEFANAGTCPETGAAQPLAGRDQTSALELLRQLQEPNSGLDYLMPRPLAAADPRHSRRGGF